MDLADLAAELERIRRWRHDELAKVIADLQFRIINCEGLLRSLGELHERTDEIGVEVTGARSVLGQVARLDKAIYGNGEPGLKQIMAGIALRQTVLIAILAPIPPLLIAVLVKMIGTGKLIP